jgi:3-hydroxyisobutyrate dehydrogenase-like beta-hydroxyacid dehydrogenase
MRVGLIGTGEMGRPLVDRLLGADHQVTVHARRPEVRDDLTAAGVDVVDDAGAVAPGHDVVILYVYSDDQVRELGPVVIDRMDAGSLLVVHTTGAPDTAIRLSGLAAAKGIGVVDAPGSGGPAQVAAGTLTLFVGGADADVVRAQALFSAYAATTVHFGPVGSGQQVKLLNNLLFGAHVELAVEAGRLCAALGLPEREVLQTLHSCSGASAAIDMAAAMGSTGTLVAAAGRFIHKDVAVARALASDLRIDLGSLGPVTDQVLERTARDA